MHITTTKKVIRFAIVGGIGAIVNTALLYTLTKSGLYYLAASSIATECAIIWNFIGNQAFTFRTTEKPFWKRFVSFQAISMVSLLATLITLATLTTLFGEKLLLAWNLIAIMASSALNFVLNLRITWAEETARTG